MNPVPLRLRHKAFALLGFMAALFLIGCEKSVPRTDYFPLRDGNRWEYRLLDNPLLGRLKDGQAIVTAPSENKSGGSSATEKEESDLSPKSETVDTGSFSDPKSSDETKKDSTKPAIARRVVLELRAAVDELTYRALYDTAEQVWSKRNGYVGFQSTRGRSYLMILPPHTGYKWVVTAPGGQNYYFEIETSDGSVSTPAGVFEHCSVARQETRDRQEVYRYWFAPNVGMVRRSKYVKEKVAPDHKFEKLEVGELHEVFRQELVEYTVKPATPATRLAEDREVRNAIAGKNRGNEFHNERDKRAHRGENEIDSKLDSVNEKVQKNSEPK